MQNKFILASTLAAGLVLHAAPALAESGDIIVTARKREELILKVPVAVTVLSSEQLEKFGTNDLYNMSQRTPGLVIGTQTASIGPQLSLRGIGTGVLNPTIDSSVSLNIDGVGLTQGLAFTSALFDSQAVQVLRGPQALFFGKNSPAGVIALTTKDPSKAFEIKLSGGYEFEAKEKVAELILSGPVTDTLGLRLAVQHSDMDGYFTNAAIGDGITGLTPEQSDFPNKEDTVIRGTALWAPSDRFDAKVKVNYTKSKTNGDGGGSQYTSCPDGITAPTGFAQYISPQENCKLDKTLYIVNMNPSSPLYAGIRNGGTPFNDMTQIFGSAELNYALTPELKLTSVSGVYTLDNHNLINGVMSGYAGPSIAADTDFQKTDLSQELRLTSDFKDSPLNFMVGGFYQDGEASNRTGLFFFGPRDKGYLTVDTKSASVFGQILYKIIPQIELAAGARYTEEKKDFSALNMRTNQPIPVQVNKLKSDNVSPELSITYSPTDDLTFFAGYRKGFKSGGWDTVSNPTAGSDVSYGDEEIEGFEGGVKARFLDRALSVNLSAYDYDYDGLQTGASIPSATTGFTIKTINAATAKTKGVDFDITYSPPQIEGLNLFAAIGYNDAKYGKFDNAPCWGGQTISQGCNRLLATSGLYTAQDLSGHPLLKAPEWTGSAGFDYAHPLANGVTLSFGTTTQWSDDFYTSTLERADTIQKAYTKTSAHIGLIGADDGWEISLIGNNLEDEVTAASCNTSNVAGGNLPGTIVSGAANNTGGVFGSDEVVCAAERPREVWVRFSFRPNVFFK